SLCRDSLLCYLFSFLSHGEPRDLHSFPTRRSSDLTADCPECSVTVIRNDLNREQSDQPRGPANTTWLPAPRCGVPGPGRPSGAGDRKSTRLNSSHVKISYAVFCLKKKKNMTTTEA